jgi:hypothetical protein
MTTRLAKHPPELRGRAVRMVACVAASHRTVMAPGNVRRCTSFADH